jgi:hypothetical protein
VDKTNVANSSPEANGVSHDQVVPKPAARVKYLSDRSHEEKWNEIVFADKSVSGDKSVSRHRVHNSALDSKSVALHQLDQSESPATIVLGESDDNTSYDGLLVVTGTNLLESTVDMRMLPKQVTVTRASDGGPHQCRQPREEVARAPKFEGRCKELCGYVYDHWSSCEAANSSQG